MTKQQIICELRERVQNEKENITTSKHFGYNTPGFNQDLGALNSLRNFLNWIEENEIN